MNTKIKSLLTLAIDNKASDLHLYSNNTPKLRVNGELVEVAGFEKIRVEEMEEMIVSVLTDGQKALLAKNKEIDFSLAVENGRFRVNCYMQSGRLAMALRVVTMDIPDFETLGLPEIMSQLATNKQGFILVTGPTGHGKSTTVASLLNKINKNQSSHIVTVEDPIEYVIKPARSAVSQRELGEDTNSFSMALRSCLRQDPNVVFVGEMRDLDTISAAITISETGHLVFSTLHTNSASQTVDRIVDVFPEGGKQQIRVQLADVLTAILSQRLVPTKEGKRVPAVELLIVTPAVRNIIREGKTFMIDNVIQTGIDLGMLSLEMSLARLVKTGVISEEVAMSYALRPSELQSSLRRTKWSDKT